MSDSVVEQSEVRGGEPEGGAADELAALKAELAARVKVQEDLEAQLKGAKSQEDLDKLSANHEARVAELNRQLTHRSVMSRFGIDDDLSEFVFGDTEAEMVARAEKLQQRIGVPGGPGTNRSGGGASGAGVGGVRLFSLIFLVRLRFGCCCSRFVLIVRSLRGS